MTLDTNVETSAAEAKGKSLTCLKRMAPFEADEHRPHKTLFDGNKTFTQNADVTNVSSQSPLVDLFYDLGENTPTCKLEDVLTRAWSENALLTLKIIFNARSIHLGKSSRTAAYGALGWLANHHPVTFLTNLEWLVHPVIEVKTPKPRQSTNVGDEDDFEIVNAEGPEFAITEAAGGYDVPKGISHGYWKDLLNLVVFAAKDQLKLDGDFSNKRGQDRGTAKELRRQKVGEQNERVQDKLKFDPFYRALHVSVAQLFAEQLRVDKALLDSGKRADLKKLSLAAKWAPTFGGFHDKHTFIVSSIAEILFPEPALYCPDATNREHYLCHRNIAAETFENIDYSRVPSIAMDRYAGLFIRKDLEHFTKYVEDVSHGKAQISGATLLPSTLVRKACHLGASIKGQTGRDKKVQAVAAQRTIQRNVVDSQWQRLVERVRNAGALQSSIAVCDVSGSMFGPPLKDGSTPLHSSIGLSLLVAEVTVGPFGRKLITFSQNPECIDIENNDHGTNSLCATVESVRHMGWGGNTNLVAVFENLLEDAKRFNVSQDEIIKQVFVFSDMQFDQGMDQGIWTSSYDRIKTAYANAGYDMPKLVYWNLAGATDKPVTVNERNTALVSGYSHGMLRAFLETGALEGTEEIIEQAVDGYDGMMEVKRVTKIDPLMVVKKSVEHDAYSMLKVVD
ncbi:hypothetical protein EJ07DRAFT_161008 [Lizonia empirigonia]|nr:hypothetical protein EJ07DRAFT_161008 [Lizonia empirigonia]